MKQKLFFTVLVFCSMVFSLSAQKTIIGKITDDRNQPIPNASIVEKGTTKGTISDIDGNYTITVSENATLVVSFVGLGSR